MCTINSSTLQYWDSRVSLFIHDLIIIKLIILLQTNTKLKKYAYYYLKINNNVKNFVIMNYIIKFTVPLLDILIFSNLPLHSIYQNWIRFIVIIIKKINTIRFFNLIEEVGRINLFIYLFMIINIT